MTVITARRLSAVSFASRGTARYIGTGLYISIIILLITGYYSIGVGPWNTFKSYYYYYYYDVGSQEHNNNNNENIHCC